MYALAGVATRAGQRAVRCLAPLLIGVLFLGASGCARSTYMGIALAAGEVAPEVRALAQHAMEGDKRAQFDLGVRFEEGKGVLRDLDRAIELYRMSASDSRGSAWIFSPPVRAGNTGQVRLVDVGLRRAGLEEARKRLAALEARQGK